jgi:hypothetical protein
MFLGLTTGARRAIEHWSNGLETTMLKKPTDHQKLRAEMGKLIEALVWDKGIC